MVAAVCLVAVAVGVFYDGGYGAGSRVAFGLAALAAAAIALRVRGAWGLVRSPLVLVLLALALLGALSAAWTLGPVGRTLRWSLVTAGYACVAVAAGVAARRRDGSETIAAGIASIAVVAGALGLWAAATFDPPYAELDGGVWRPGGPLEYPPALALLQVSALPALLVGMLARSRLAAAVAAGGTAVAGGVLALSASRTAVAMAAALCASAVVFPRETIRRPRPAVAAALALGGVAAVAFQVALGGAGRAGSGTTDRVLVAVLVTVVAGLLWTVARRGMDGRQAKRTLPRRAVPAGLAVLVTLSVAAGLLAFGPSAGRAAGGGVLHARPETWRAAIVTFADRPLTGAGADAFLAGSARHQDGKTVVFAHDLPLELAAELGILGLLLALALYGVTGGALWRARRASAGWLLAPAAAAFLVAGLVDWPWHLAGAGAVWAAAVGALTRGKGPHRDVRLLN